MIKILKKSIAMIEVIAMIIALTSGFCLGMMKDTYAATDRILDVNTKIDVISEDGESKKYTFRAPKSGVYCFATKGNYAVDANIYIDEKLCGAGKYVVSDYNFVLEQYIKKGQECIIEIYLSGDLYFETELYVFGTSYAKNVVVDFWGDYPDCCNVGDSVTLGLKAINLLGEKIDFDEGIYEWYKVKIDENTEERIEEISLGTTDGTYTIDEVETNDFWEQDGYYVIYEARIYDIACEKYWPSIIFTLEEKPEYTYRSYEKLIVGQDDSITMTAKAYDYDNNEIDISGDEYSFKWYRREEYTDVSGEDVLDETNLDTTDGSYTIDRINRTDFYQQSDSIVWYVAEIYKNNQYICQSEFDLYNKYSYLYIQTRDYFATEGNSVKLEPIVYDFGGNVVDVSGDEYSFKWSKVRSNGATIELKGAESSYTIRHMDAADFSGTDKVKYEVSLYKDDEFVNSASFQIYDKSEYICLTGNDYTVSEGDSVTLTPKALDYFNDERNVSFEEYSFKWYKVKFGDDKICEEEELEESGLSYTINNVKATDFYNSNSVAYKVELYKNGKFVCETYMYIYRECEQTTTGEQQTTLEKPITGQQPIASEQPTSNNVEIETPAKAAIKKVTANKTSAKKVKVSLEKIAGANGYQVAVYTTMKNAKKNKKAIVTKFVKNVSATISSKKLKNKKVLFVKVRAYTLDGKKKVYGKWSTVKKVKIK